MTRKALIRLVLTLITMFMSEGYGIAQITKDVFVLNVNGNRTTEQILSVSNFIYTDLRINDQDLPMRPYQGSREIVLISMSDSFTYQDALIKLNKLGLEQPVYEDALFFGEQYPEKPFKFSVMFPHEPISGPNGRLDVMSLLCDVGGRLYALNRTNTVWDSETLVAGVRK